MQCYGRVEGEIRDLQGTVFISLVAALGVERWRQRCKDLAGVLGKNPDVVSYWVGKGVRRRNDDPAFAKRIDEIDERLEKAVRAKQERQSG